ncbi:MAG: aminoacyl-tRNA hydrolase [Patescibacteria group bacterium]|jgi:PTH1 family peptidyl-tRNA hydrolase
MKLIVGLGNPGKKYETTWHNVGFLVIDLLKTKQAGEFLSCNKSKKFKAEICENNSPEEKIILAKPQTFMNNSGQAVKAIGRFYKIKPENLWVIHDDIDLPLGKIRISQNASAAGHKGVQSIIDEVGTQEFIRFRLGIQPITPLKMPTEKYVLQKIDSESKVIIDEVIEKVLAALEIALAQGVTEAMNEFN